MLYINLNCTDNYYFSDLYIEVVADKKAITAIDVNYSKNSSEYEISFNECIAVSSADSIVDIFVVGIDNLGLTHKYIVFSGNESNTTLYNICEIIYDSKGNLLTDDFK